MTNKEVPRVSVIIPVGKRQCDARQIYQEYKTALTAIGATHEFIFVLDGPQRAFETGLRRLAAEGQSFAMIALTRPFGETTCLMIGLEYATGEVVLNLPAYFQISAGDIPRLVSSMDDADVVVCHRYSRESGWLERLRRRVFHSLLTWVTRVRFNDLGCAARAMHRRVLEEIRLYGDQQRFLPLLAERHGFRVKELQVRPSLRGAHPDMYKRRPYARALLDILNVLFLLRFTKKPLRFFGMIGATLFALGFLGLAYLVAERIALHLPLADRPALMLASLFIVLGVQIFAIGLLGELIIFAHAGSIKDYQVESISQFPARDQPEHSSGIARTVQIVA